MLKCRITNLVFVTNGYVYFASCDDLSLRVFQTEDYGVSWRSVSEGLPTENTFDIVLRQSFSVCDSLMVFGTTNGNLFSADTRSLNWVQVTSNLTKVGVVVIV